MTSGGESKIVCKPTDGLYKNGHPECENCFWKVRNICQIYSNVINDKPSEEILFEELKRIKKAMKGKDV